MNCKRIMIGHRPDNLVAGELYESLGFKSISEEDRNAATGKDGSIIELLDRLSGQLF